MQSVSGMLMPDDVTLEISNGGKFKVKDGYCFATGMIIMWSGTIATIPTGFALCDGANGTPDLRDRMIIGAKQDDAGASKTNVTGALTKSGGAATHTLTTAELPAHAHNATVYTTGYTNSHNNGSYFCAAGRVDEGSGTAATANAGTGDAHSILNPYYALAFIMKT